jgi:hypothetical protein
LPALLPVPDDPEVLKFHFRSLQASQSIVTARVIDVDYFIRKAVKDGGYFRQ